MTPAAEEAALVVLPGGVLSYTLRRSPRARRIRVVVDPRRGVVVTVPGRRLSVRDGRRLAQEFVQEREGWIRRHVESHTRQLEAQAARGPLAANSTIRYRGREHRLIVVPGAGGVRRVAILQDVGAAELIVRPGVGETRPLEALLEPWLRDRARDAIEAAVAIHAQGLGVRPVSITIRDTRSRWGSASRAGRLSFSWRLILAPPEALETVVVHELAHLRVFGHGPRFWALVASRIADHQSWRRWLREHSVELHATLQRDAEVA